MVSKRTEEYTEKQIVITERVLGEKLKLYKQLAAKVRETKKSKKNNLKASRKQNEISEKFKKLKSQRELLKYSPYIKCDYLHNLSALIGLINQYENFIRKLEYRQKSKLGVKNNEQRKTNTKTAKES